MKLNLNFAELHTPLFLAGKNFGMKLEPTKVTGLELVYDRTEKELVVTYNKKTALIPTSNVVSMTLDDGDRPIPDGPVPLSPHKKIKAQVSSPTSHVFAGEKEPA